jgi:hypothetical protein
MEQRPLRLGDIVDDYCPRERRITNHAIVALVGDSIRQTRCSTCDADHVYKQGKVPRRRKKDAPDALYEEVLTDLTGGQLVAKENGETSPAELQAAQDRGDAAAPDAASADPSKPATEDDSGPAPADDLWPAHRTLIRATLPKVEGGEPPPRPIPEFTMHQRQGRGGHGFRHAHGQGWAGGNGHGRNNGFRPERSGNGPGQGSGRPGGGGGRHGRHRSRHKNSK